MNKKMKFFSEDGYFSKPHRGIVAILGCAVAVATVGALMLPAVTASKPACGIEEHQHTVECYDETALICGKDEHLHTDACRENALSEEDLQSLKAVNTRIEKLPDPEGLKAEIEEFYTNHDRIGWETYTERVNKELLTIREDYEALPAAVQSLVENVEKWETLEALPELTVPPETPENGGIIADSPTELPSEPEIAQEPTEGEPPAGEEPTEGEPEITDPIDLTDSNYVKSGELATKELDKDGNPIGNWTSVTGNDITFDKNYALKLTVHFEGVPTADLIAADGKLTYTLPALFRDVKADGSLLDASSNAVGTISVSGNTVTLDFDTEWLKEKQAAGQAGIAGTFYVTSYFNLKEIGADNTGTIKIGNTEIKIHFDDDFYAKNCTVRISKALNNPKVIETEDGDYLEYTLTVKAGGDGCPDVYVVDQFRKTDRKYIDSYVTEGDNAPKETSTLSNYTQGTVEEIVEDEEPAARSLKWTIGDMEPNETRTLTYRVKLKDGFAGTGTPYNGDAAAIRNIASVYTKDLTEPKDDAFDDFVRKGKGTMEKKILSTVMNADGSCTLTYQVWVQTLAGNNYTVDDVIIKDGLNWATGNGYRTDAKYLPYLTIEKDSFKLYEGKGTTGTEITLQDGNPAFSEDGHSFAVNVGNMAPDTYRTVTYNITLAAEAFAKFGNDLIPVKNRAEMQGKDLNGGYITMNGYNTDSKLTQKTWTRKVAGTAIEEDMNIEIPTTDSVYDKNKQKLETPPASFPVPEVSYGYQVIVNEAGDWDISAADLKDALAGVHLNFTGYVKVDAFTVNFSIPAKGNNSDEVWNQNVLNAFNSKTPTRTAWMNIDELTEFSFKPTDLGFESGSYALRLTYYAHHGHDSNVINAKVSNDFHMSGTVGVGDETHTLEDAKSSADVLITGDGYFHAEKQPWYYERTQDGYPNGALYWIIKLEGNIFPAGTQIKDTIVTGNGTTAHRFHNSDSLVGIYGAPTSLDFSEYPTLEDFHNADIVERDTDDYTAEISGNNLTITLNVAHEHAVTESMYLIVRTEPSVIPTQERDAFTYSNKLSTCTDEDSFIDQGTASQTLYGSENIFKEFGMTATYDGSADTVEKDSASVISKTDHARTIYAKKFNLPAGTYVSWQIHVNYEGNLQGDYIVTEHIPEGMEFAYVRMSWFGERVRGDKNKPAIIAVPELAEDGWKYTTATAIPADSGCGNPDTHFYTKGQEAKWKISNLTVNTERYDYAAVEFQVVCRVTDPDVLQGGAEKTFNNVVSLSTLGGEEIGRDSDAVSLKRETLSKEKIDDEHSGSILPFSITVNDLGEDLVISGDTITLVDEMSNGLMLFVETIEVKNTKTGEKIENWDADLKILPDGGRILRLTLPDNLPLTVTYDCKVNVPPNQTISISNKAHWEGYEAPTGGTVEEENFSYEAGGSVDATDHPTLKLLKVDEHNLQHKLAGAEFKLEEVTYNEQTGEFEVAENGTTLAGTTDSNGIVTFGTSAARIEAAGDTNLLKFNTIYRLTETKAPEGYVLDTTPKYVAVAKEIEGEDGQKHFPTFPNGVIPKFDGGEMHLDWFNEKGTAQVEKKFLDAGGHEVTKIDGTYTFGIYLVDGETETLHQKQTICIDKSENARTAVFTNLESGKTYRVYELDDNGEPIKDRLPHTISGKDFLVTYSTDESFTIKIENGTQENAAVTVTNQVFYPELPHAGGIGTALFFLSGGVLAVGALILLITKRRIGIR